MNHQLHHSLFGKMYFNEKKNPTNYKYLKSEQKIYSRGFAIYLMAAIYLDEGSVLCFKVKSNINIFCVHKLIMNITGI